MAQMPPMSPSGALAQLQNEKAQMQQFVDGWYGNMTHAGLALCWNRKRSCKEALDVLSAMGIQCPAPEEAYAMEEEALVAMLVDKAPVDVRHSLRHVTKGLLQAAADIGAVRKGVEAGNADFFVASVEDASHGAGQMILRRAVESAAKEAAKIVKCTLSWHAATEARIAQLTKAKEEAETLMHNLKAVESQLTAFKQCQAKKSASALMAFCGNQTKTQLKAAWGAWFETAQASKSERCIHDKWRAEHDSRMMIVKQLRERHSADIMKAMAWKICEDVCSLLEVIMSEWRKVVEDIHNQENIRKVNEARSRMEALKAQKRASTLRVIAESCFMANESLVVKGFEALRHFSEGCKRERAKQSSIQALQVSCKAKLDGKKSNAKTVLVELCKRSADSLAMLTFQSWSLEVQEYRRSRELDDAMRKSDQKLSMLRSRQHTCAAGVDSRLTQRLNMMLMVQVMSAWLLVVKTQNMERGFVSRLEKKRQQLNGVQTLFTAFAAQLDSSLSTEIDSSRTKGDASSGWDTTRKQRKSMQRGSEGTISLPDIHRRWPE